VKHLSGAPLQERLLALPTNIIIIWKGLAVKHSRLLQTFVYYGCKKFYNIGPRRLQRCLDDIFYYKTGYPIPGTKVSPWPC
jgi:hypothetical protein